jgi:hypothetical protein
MLLVTLEGLPHAGRSAVLRHLVHARPDWAYVSVLPEPAATCSWPTAAARAGHALFASLLRKTKAVAAAQPPAGRAAAAARAILLSCPWLEHLPRSRPLWALRSAVTRELVARLGIRVHAHAMVVLHVPHDETFEQMVCCGNPYWNGTSLSDVAATQACIAQQAARAQDGTADHPFPCAVCTVHCPPFFEENEVVARAITARILAFVDGLGAATSAPTTTTAANTT